MWRPTPFTFQVPSGLGSDETTRLAPSRSSPGTAGVRSRSSASINDHDLEVLPTLSGPFGPPVFPYTIASLSALPDHLPGTAMEGIGGEPLFGGPPLVLEDLARRGMLAAVTKAARTFHRDLDVLVHHTGEVARPRPPSRQLAGDP